MVWQTNIYDRSITRIIALSDIHGDIHALIIALRDCAQVIKKKNGSNLTNPSELDRETEELLEMDLNISDKYVDDLNYEWCGGNTHIVICGDILDGYRMNNFRRKASSSSRCGVECVENEYDQIEIKIYRFINALNKSSGSRIHKILGNHEIINLFEVPPVDYSEYVPPRTRDLNFFYYHGNSRRDYFKWNNEGGRLIFEDGAGIFLKINNNLFVHGQIEHTKTLADYEKINKEINEAMSTEVNYKLYNVEDGSFGTTLFGRFYDNFFSRLNQTEQHQKCIDIKDNLKNFIVPSELYIPTMFRIIVGHCVQSLRDRFNYINSTFSQIKKDGVREIVSGQVITGKFDSTNQDNQIFGISMECDKKTLDDPKERLDFEKLSSIYDKEDVQLQDVDEYERYIYKVDIGTSRAFDNFNTLPDRNSEKLYLGSRVPQVLELTPKTVRILRSTIKNTRIHQPRPNYESNIRMNPELNKDTYKKYLKYKIKYQNLKNKFSL